MPFLFPSSNSDNPSSDEEVHHARSSSSLISQQMIRGRRKFKTGKEVPIVSNRFDKARQHLNYMDI